MGLILLEIWKLFANKESPKAGHDSTHQYSQLLGRLMQENSQYVASLSNLERPCLKRKEKGLGMQLRGVPDSRASTSSTA